MKRTIYILVGILAYLLVAYHLADIGFTALCGTFANCFTLTNLPLLVLVLIMMLAVWAVEAQKWGIATRCFAKNTFLHNWKSVWYGLVVGQLTPNRVGEPIGRIAFIEPEHRGKAIAASIWCSFSQQLVTLIFGAVGLAVWFLNYKMVIDSNNGAATMLTIFLIVLLIALPVLMWKYSWILSKIEQFGPIRRALRSERIEFVLSNKNSIAIIALSAIKYLIFSTQYVILLHISGVEANIFSLYMAIAISYLFTSFVPSFAATELGIRLSAAISFIGALTPNLAGVTSAATLLWLCNIALPVVFAAWSRLWGKTWQ